MDFDPYEPEFADRLADHGIHAALVGQWMHKGKPEKMAGIARNDPCHFSIRMKISIGKRGKDHRSVDAGSAHTLEIFVERSGGVGRLSQAVAFSSMTMAVDNHGALVDCLPFCETAAGQRRMQSFTGRRPQSCCRDATNGRSPSSRPLPMPTVRALSRSVPTD